MFKIGICDDEKLERDYLEKIVGEYFQSIDKKYVIITYRSAENFLFEMDALDILLLDIQMEELTGMDLARKIRKDDQNLSIVFITGISDYIAEGYDVNASNYLIKPVSREKLVNVLDSIIAKKQDTKYIMIQTERGATKIDLNDIFYIESNGHYINIQTKDKLYTCKNTLGNIEEQLDSSFIKIHRSYVVNLKHISLISKTDITLDNKAVIPLSRRRYADVNKAFINFFKGGNLNV